jgi:hypothetical protein
MQQVQLDERDIGAVIVSAAAGLAGEAYKPLLRPQASWRKKITKRTGKILSIAKNYLAL